ncbi:MAG: DUF5711 family protein [Eubacteriales bacterium]|nr:DUF5711 family protein [Eubacteriales bacterium]
MTDIREYLQRKEKKEDKKSEDFKAQIRAHRLKLLVRSVLIVGVLAAMSAAAYFLLKNQTYTGYTVVSVTERHQTSGSSLTAYQNGFITYSKDGISYTDYKGNAMWNQTYDMQEPKVSVNGGRVAVGDYNGNLIYNIAQDGTVKQIDTNLPIKNLSVSANGVVAAILEDGDVTWINVYNPSGEKAVGIKTTMAKSGYPMYISLSDTGRLMLVSYLKVESGSMKSVVSFYNFDEVGQNYTDTMVSSYEYADAIVPFAVFGGSDMAFSVASNQFMIYEGDQIPKNIFQNFLQEQIRDVRYSDGRIGFVFEGTDGSSKYRIDLYDSSGKLTLSVPFNMEYRDILISGDELIIYNEAECMIMTLHGREKYNGAIPEQTQLLKPLGGNRFLAVTRDSMDLIEMK